MIGFRYIRERSNSDPEILWSPNFALRTPESRFGKYSPALRLVTSSPASATQRRNSPATFFSAPSSAFELPQFHGGAGERTVLLSRQQQQQQQQMSGAKAKGTYNAVGSTAPIAMANQKAKAGRKSHGPGSTTAINGAAGEEAGMEPSSL